MTDHKGLPVLAFPTLESWERWLAAQDAACPGLWLKFARKAAKLPSVSKAEAIAAALAQGWIDGQLDAWDDRHWLVRFTPRGPASKWSQINRATAERLIAEGRMRPAGQAAVDRAKADGRWEAAYPPQGRAEVPADLQAALDAAMLARGETLHPASG